MNFDKLNDLTKRFILSEGQVTVATYVQSLNDILESISPRTLTDKNRIIAAKNTLREIRLHTKRLEQRVQVLQERIQILEEDNEAEEIVE